MSYTWKEVQEMITATYCLECGNVIPNVYEMKFGDDIIDAWMHHEVRKQPTTLRRIWTLIEHKINEPYIDREILCFCNQKHKDKFAKRLGLRKRNERRVKKG